MTEDFKELGAFLRIHRSKLDPKVCGFEPSQRRRTSGLRREEVAQLANISTTLYTKLEQGKIIGVSSNILNKIAEALQLNDIERNYMMVLAQKYPKIRLKRIDEMARKELFITVNTIKESPAFVVDSSWNIVAWNDLFIQLSGDYNTFSEYEKNIMYRLFMDESLKALINDWETMTKKLVDMYRVCYTVSADKSRYLNMILRLKQKSAYFNECWETNSGNVISAIQLELDHPEFGKLRLKNKMLTISDLEGHGMFILLPNESSQTEIVLKSLAENSYGEEPSGQNKIISVKEVV